MEHNGLVYALLLDGEGGGRVLDWQDINNWTPSQGKIWIHLSYTSPETSKWLYEKSGLESFIIDSLLSEETRPRSTVIGKGLLLNLRGVNLNPGADVEDMVSLRLWADENRIISTRKRHLLSITDLRDQFTNGCGPTTTSQFLLTITELITSRIESAVDTIETNISLLEEQVTSTHDTSLRTQLSAVRRESIILRRYLAPQREAIARLQVENIGWMSEMDKRHVHENANSLIRIVEDLDSLRDRATVAQEELVNAMSAQLNARMYVLSIITAIFLPLSFFTGLLGINVGGIPGADYKWSFAIVIFLLLCVCIGQYLYFRKKRWL